MPLPAPLWLIMAASVVQSALVVALAVWGGVALAPAVGLRAPAFEAAALRQPITSALKPQILPGFISGMLGGLMLFASLRSSPAAIASLQGQFSTEWDLLMAGSVIALLPVLLIYIIGQKWFVQGITLSGLGGR